MTLGYKLKKKEKNEIGLRNMLPKKLVLQILFFQIMNVTIVILIQQH